MFYQNNTFAIARKYTRWDPLHDAHGVFITRAIPWLEQLGSRIHLLRKLVLDFDTICPSDCLTAQIWDSPSAAPEEVFDIGPLLRTVWAEDLQLTIEVIQPKNEAYTKCAAEHAWSMTDVSCLALNNAIRCIQEDVLHVRTFRLLLRHLLLRRDASGGMVVFTTSRD